MEYLFSYHNRSVSGVAIALLANAFLRMMIVSRLITVVDNKEPSHLPMTVLKDCVRLQIVKNVGRKLRAFGQDSSRDLVHKFLDFHVNGENFL